MKKLLILENNKGGDEIYHRVTLETIRAALEQKKVVLTPGSYEKDTYDSPDDVIYSSSTPFHDWNICLRTVYIPPEYGTDYFEQKLTQIINAYKPDCILFHLGLYVRRSTYSDYPVIKVMLRYAEEIDVIVYTGNMNDRESLVSDTNGHIRYFFNNRNIDNQIDFLMELLH